MWKTYKYIYYWLYTWQRKLWGEKDIPEFNAIIGMSMSLAAISASIAIIIELITDIQVIPADVPKGKIIVLGILLLAVHYFLFMHKGKYRKIEKEFKNESKEERKRKGHWVLFYAFGSLAFFIFLLFFGIWVKN